MVSTEDRERHANNLELFLDLVFVFAVTQIASLVAHDLTWSGVGRGALIAFLVWWQWSQYTWAGAAVDLQQHAVSRLFVLGTIPATLTMAAAIPEAFHATGRWFGVAYLVVQLLVLLMQGGPALEQAATRVAFLRYESVAAVMPVVVAVGGFVAGNARLAAWVAAALLSIVSALRGASRGEWAINPVHFAERHALFIIISLGEALVAIGASATEVGLSGRVLGGLVSAAFLAAVVWWMYFAYVPGETERHLRTTTPQNRAVEARDAFTFGHFPLVAGILAYAVVAKEVVREPAHALDTGHRWLLAGALVLIVGSFMHLQWRIVRHVARERLVALPVLIAVCAVGRSVAGPYLVAITGAVLLVMHSISWRNFRRVSGPG